MHLMQCIICCIDIFSRNAGTVPPLVSALAQPTAQPTSVPPAATQPAQELSFSSTDPFLVSGFHSRTESQDSGLGLGNGTYPHPHTPEDFLNAMEDVEVTPAEVKQPADLVAAGPEVESMDTEDLVPSIVVSTTNLLRMRLGVAATKVCCPLID